MGLVFACFPICFQRNRMTFAIHITGNVFGWPAQFYECLLQMAALAGVNNNRGVIDSCAEQGRNFLALEDFFENRDIECLED